ncbi:MAG: putative bifunctional diguanylate cyclase/phosphodiesterase [Thiohalomonadales bacterium]
MHLNQTSLKSRLIVLTLVILVIVITLVMYGQQLNKNTSSRNIDSSHVLQQVKVSLSKINSVLQVLEKELYEQIVSADEDRMESIFDSYSILLNEIKLLENNTILKSFIVKYNIISGSKYYKIQKQTKHVLEDVLLLKTMLFEFNKVSLNSDKRYLAIGEFESVLLPINNKINLFLEQHIQNQKILEDDFEAIKVYRTLRDIQYLWLLQIQSVRQFIASKSGLTGDREQSIKVSLGNRKKYLIQLGIKVKELKDVIKVNSKSSITGSNVNELNNLFSDFNINFERTKDTNLSESWRNDVSLLENNIQPQIDYMWENLLQLEIVISALTQESILLTQSTSDKISQIIWYSALIILVVMLVIYVTFEFSLRRPIVAVAKALDAEAKGESGPPITKSYSTEIVELLNAFSNMRMQVKVRQTRLQSILDNTLEGIVITNEQGIIESFNQAAEELFKFPANKIIGKDVSILIPWADPESHSDKIQHYLKTGVTTIVGKKREVEAIRQDGHVFPASIKVTEMVVEGKRYFTAVVEDISQQKALIDDLQFQANHDSLTNLYNRFYFITELDKIVNQHVRGDSNKYAVIYLDLDNFKYVNDTMGHMAGDQLIREVSSLLQNRTRKTDILARLGGDEFAILLFHEKNLKLEYVSDSFRKILSDFVFKYEGSIVDITCSIGAAHLNNDVKTKENLLARADFACHEAKRLGRNQAYVYSKSDDAQVSDMSREFGWTHRIRDALDNEKFILACQPIINTQDNTVSYYEVLLRMLDFDDKIILPFGFIPAAERFGLMLEIDAWVIKNSIQLLANQHKFNPELKLSINLSAHSLDNDSTFELIRNEIERNNVNPEKLLFEVTETVAIANIKTATIFLNNIRSLGCKTALDDFGVGYSSFAYLADLPIDVVKIDGFFVKEMATKSLNKTMVSAINDIAHELGKTTVAEFVEDQDIYNLLKEIGVDYSQGYHLGKPKIVYDSLKNIDDLFTEVIDKIAQV